MLRRGLITQLIPEHAQNDPLNHPGNAIERPAKGPTNPLIAVVIGPEGWSKTSGAC